MLLFLTSHIGGSRKVGAQYFPAPLIQDNGLVDNLKAHWQRPLRMLLIASNPHDAEKSNAIRACFAEAFPLSGLPLACIHLCDAANESYAERLRDYDVLLLCGGHVPTQNAFFKKIRLKDRLCGYSGILIAISAGTMNSAETVYAQPELPGEAIDPHYRRFLPGLCLTHTMVLPHWQALCGETLDGLRLLEDVTLPDSRGRTFCALCDGSYILSEDGTETLHGEAFRIHDGTMEKVCENGQHILL